MRRAASCITLALILTSIFPLSQAPSDNTAENLDELFQNISRGVVGFAGFYYRNEVLVIRLAKPSPALANAEMAQITQALAVAGLSRVLESIESGRYTFETSRYSFNQLAQWRQAVLSNPEMGVFLTAVDIDEVNNRLFIGVPSLEQVEVVRGMLESMGIPQDGYSVQPLLIEPMVGLRDHVRPVVGGLQIAFSFYLCTLGFNAIRYGVLGYVTNDHCTDNMGQVDGTNHYQPSVSSANWIGWETVDPPFFTSSPCPSGYRCRYSDSAFNTYGAGVPHSLGKIARTAGLGSIDIVGEWTIVSEASYPISGQTLNKVGRTTGWTQGQVTNTCVTTYVANTNIVRFCQDFVQAGSAPGDSGSPVFEIVNSSAYTVRLHGILWGGSGGTLFVFSSMSNVESELGPLETFPQQPTIIVTTPNGGEHWVIGNVYQIQWVSQNLAGNVDILISRDGGSTWSALFTNIANDGSEPWTVTGPPTTTAKIRIRSSTNPSVYDDSDGFFTIGLILALTSPNGGEVWHVGTIQTIAWASQPYGRVGILLSRDGGSTWETIVSATDNDGSYLWRVAGPPTSAALVRIVSIEAPWVADTSDSAFSIVDLSPPSVKVVAPNGGEVLKIGRIYTIRWLASDPGGIQQVVVEFSGDGGNSWQQLAVFNGNPGFYRWRVQVNPTTQALIKITAYDNAGHSSSDVSDSFFKVRY